jgi:hypothetical protein
MATATTKVTYTPRDPSSPAEMVWNGVKFRAHVPVELNPVKHSYFIPIVKKWVDPLTQRTMSLATEERVLMVDVARGNADFVVEGSEPTVAPKAGKAKPPKTSEEYRAHAVAWINAAQSIDDLERWNDEEQMRETCGCGEDDERFLQPMFDAKFKQLSAAEVA